MKDLLNLGQALLDEGKNAYLIRERVVLKQSIKPTSNQVEIYNHVTYYGEIFYLIFAKAAMSNILIVWSNYYPDLAQKQLESCLSKLKCYDYCYQIETVEAGTYEIPAVIQHVHKVQPFDAYLPLSLLLKGKTDHYEFIWEHVKECFIKFAIEGLTIGNGIISAPGMDTLQERVENEERVEEAINAVDYLIRFKNKYNKNTQV